MDFFKVETRSTRKGVTEIVPSFIVGHSTDIMIRGGFFYAVWDEEVGLWSTNEYDVVRLIDKELWNYYDKIKDNSTDSIIVRTMQDYSSKSWSSYRHYISQCPDNFKSLDSTLIFADTITKKEDYASKRLPYSLSDGDHSAWTELLMTLYEQPERQKIEWAIGAIISGDAKTIQKFLVFYGDAGTGKSTVLNIIQQIFTGYYCIFDAKSLATSTNQFSMEAFKSNPLVAIQHDGDLSKIEDNSKLNSIIAHEEMTINEKHKSLYVVRLNSFLFMATNKPVKITDAKSGLIRRLIDVNPSGKLIQYDRYNELMSKMDFEIGAIAKHCLDVYEHLGKHFYDNYRSSEMQYKTDVFFNFIDDKYFIFSEQDGISLKQAYSMYREYCQETSLSYTMPMYLFREELKNYFEEFHNRSMIDGKRVRSYYSGFKKDKFDMYEDSVDFGALESRKEANDEQLHSNDERSNIDTDLRISSTSKGREKVRGTDTVVEDKKSNSRVVLDSTSSIFDEVCADCLAQYATSDGKPIKKWVNVKTRLRDIDTSKLHYVKLPENHIVIDFDLKDSNGNKSAEKNLEAASKFPSTYAEFSKSGAGIHLHYIYDGDSVNLSRLYADGIEIKVFSGNSSLRRQLTKCNNLDISHISGGLPLKEKKVISTKSIKNERSLRNLIKRNLRKEIHPATKPSIDFIYKILDDAYNSGMRYDVSDMEGTILAFAVNSTNQAPYCIKTVEQMRFKSKDFDDEVSSSIPDDKNKDCIDNSPLVFYDIEVFPNLLLVNYKAAGEGKPMHRLVNPTPQEIEPLLSMKLVGYNNRRYDNHIIYGRYLGKNNKQIYEMSKAIISGTKEEQRNAMYGEAYNISYTDIYDFASAGNKMSLKKAEIEMGIHHQELGKNWDEPVPEDEWIEVSEYCDNDVYATEARFNWLKGDWTARQILADLAGMSVNDTTNALTTRFIFGNNRSPQNEFNYRNLGEPIQLNELDDKTVEFLKEACPDMMATVHPVRDDFTDEELNDIRPSVLPYFPGYKFEYKEKTVAGRTIRQGVSTYRGEEIGEGGYVYSEPGIYTDVALLDITSMHPHSTIAECLFGPRYTRAFREIVNSRVTIKHQDWERINGMLDGKLSKYVDRVLSGEMTSDELALAMKTAINSVYGLTSAKFPNAFKDPRNIDNIVAKRGALFMVDLKHAVQERGFTVAHIKTDSIKIPNATPSIIQFVMDFGKKYGYNFEHEATYDRMCLVNKAVYIARYKTGKKAGKWTATGTQFQQPYVFKTLFSHEPITFDDMCETKNVKTAMYLDMNEGYPLHPYSEEEYNEEIERIVNVTLNKKSKMIQNDKAKYDKLKEEIYSDVIEKYKGPKIGDLVDSHNYVFIGRAGQFCPIIKDAGGGILVREQDGKYVSVTDSSDYRWLESEMVRSLHMEDAIDINFYRNKVDEAIAAISEYGDFEWFVSNDEDPSKIEVP